MLVGGLGLGFTVHEVLADDRVERVVVVEIEEALVRWIRDGTVPHGRPTWPTSACTSASATCARSVAEAAPGRAYDLVLLDVDNGPGFLVHEDNAAVYEAPFLEPAARPARAGGVLAVWSSTERRGARPTRCTEVFGDLRRRVRTRCACRTATSTTGSTSASAH